MKIFLLILATTVLTCSGVAGLFFLKLFARHAAVAGVDGQPRRAGRYLLLAVISFGVSFGSGALLNYLLSRV
jgi:hypothetical protein